MLNVKDVEYKPGGIGLEQTLQKNLRMAECEKEQWMNERERRSEEGEKEQIECVSKAGTEQMGISQWLILLRSPCLSFFLFHHVE